MAHTTAVSAFCFAFSGPAIVIDDYQYQLLGFNLPQQETTCGGDETFVGIQDDWMFTQSQTMYE